MDLQDQNYRQFLKDLKQKIKTAQIKAALSVNKELLQLYWEIGKSILESQNTEGWGAKTIPRLAKDLRIAFPDIRGFSERNLKYMRQFADVYPDFAIVQTPLAQITWYHNITLLTKVKDKKQRLWYAHKAIENGWSRNVMVHQIELGLFERQGKAINNFDRVLPKPQSDLAKETLKSPYIFDFLNLTDNAKERELEKALLSHITQFLLELGKGFALVGNQYHVSVGDDDFYIDLLFYHLELRAFIAIELKTGDFKPEYAGKMNFYLSALDSLVKKEKDNASIGLILYKGRNEVVVEYALRGVAKPMGVSEYELIKQLPDNIKSSLPTIEELENTLSDLEDA